MGRAAKRKIHQFKPFITIINQSGVIKGDIRHFYKNLIRNKIVDIILPQV